MLFQVPIAPGGGLNPNVPTNETAAELSDPNRISELFSRFLGFMTIAAGLTFLIYFVIGGLNWLTSGGDQNKVDAAKKYMTNGIIGLIIVVASYAIMAIIGNVLGLEILNPAEALRQIVDY